MTRDDPIVMTGLAILITGGIILAYPWIVIAIGLSITAVVVGHFVLEDVADNADEYQAIADRADHQHQLVMQGDPAGIYGEWPPADA